MTEIITEIQENNRKKLNIAFVCDPITDYTAGSFISTLRFAESLSKKGHKIVFIAAKSPKNRYDGYHLDIKIYRFFALLLPKTENKLYVSFPTHRQVKNILINEKIDILHVIIPTPSVLISMQAAKSLGIKIVAHSHTQPENIFLHFPKFIATKAVNRSFYRLLTWLYLKADVLIYPSEFAKNLFALHNHEIRNVVISNGVDTNRFRKQDPDGFFAKYNIPKDKKIVLYVGRFHPEKSVDTLIKSIPHIISKEPCTHFVFVGFGHLEDSFKKLAKKLGLNKHVTFCGRVSDEDLVLAYNACDLFVLPSLAELEGMVVLEVMSCGKPIVIANAPDSASTYFVDGNGLLFIPEDEKDLAEKCLKILADNELRQRMAERSFEKSRQYDIEECVRQLEDVYYSLL